MVGWKGRNRGSQDVCLYELANRWEAGEIILERLFEIKLCNVRPLVFVERHPQASCLALKSAPMIYVLLSDRRYRAKLSVGNWQLGWK